MPDYFINPYAFIALPGGRQTAEAPCEGDKLTGKLTFTLTNRTPLFIPNTTNDHALVDGDVGEGDDKRHKSYEFFSYTDLSGKQTGSTRGPCEPVIPGASLRGVFRSVYETLTGSCLSQANEEFVSEEQWFHRRMYDPHKPGLIVKTVDGQGAAHYALHKARRERAKFRDKGCQHDSAIKLLKFLDIYETCRPVTEYKVVDYSNGEAVWATTREGTPSVRSSNRIRLFYVNELRQQSNPPNGYIQLGEDFEKKRYFGVFTKGECVLGSSEFDFGKPENEYRKQLEQVIAHYGEKYNENYVADSEALSWDPTTGTRPTHSGYRAYKEALDAFIAGDEPACFPVFYQKYKHQGNGPAMYRLVPAAYSKHVEQVSGKLLRDSSPCSTKEGYCPACALFGFVGEGGQSDDQAPGRVRVTDAKLADAQQAKYEDPMRLYELASPKHRSTKNYLESHGVNWGDWDYGKAIKRQSVPIYSSNYKARPSGRKYYWQHPDDGWKSFVETSLSSEDKIAKTSRNMTMRPLKAGRKFEFSVYFERLSRRELQVLIASITLGPETKAEQHYHLVGHARPFGFGSVSIRLKQLLVRKQSLNVKRTAITRSVAEPSNMAGYEVSLQNLHVPKDLLYTTACRLDTITRLHDFGQGCPIRYPFVSGKEFVEGYEWYKELNGKRNSSTLSGLIRGKDAMLEVPVDYGNDENLASIIKLPVL
ncbi:MAG: TIGR03986 family CRISPR-associated RAMP protein [Coriobacteriales bacterium]|jgi:CRISPR-associated protein (TIGR03986 family)|nr:TIGR03986 family CRISPR-associated RAMP protein [Coriobacteriales bacterium]